MINAQTLIGTVLGTVTLQKVIGQGESGVVFLAQQSPTAPQVAVRMLSPAATQMSAQGAAFLERFHKEINVVSSLQHPNILPVLAYGKHDGMAYMVMPYISGETLQSMIERQGQLPLSLVANYLDQLSNALDYAHKQGILHLNLKPGNVFLTNGERLLLGDFGLTKMDERQALHMRLLRAGKPVGSLDYMAPEQIMGDVVDARTDLYSLGVMLYQAVTGKTPFQIGTPQQIASQVLQAPPPSPRLLRNDLPQAAEQVILQALAKRPLDRHASAQDIAKAFRVALTTAGSLAEPSSSTIAGMASATAAPLFTPRKRGLFDPVWQQPAREEEQVRPITSNQSSSKSTGLLTAEGLAAFRSSENQVPVDPREPEKKVPDVPTFPETPLPPTPPRPVFKSSGLLPMNGSESAPKQVSPPASAGVAPNLTKPLTTSNDERPTTGALPITNPIPPLQATNTTGTMTLPGELGANGTMKLTGAVKLVQVPVAGQPGRYVTGFLPVSPDTEKPEESPNKPANDPPAPQNANLQERLWTPQKVNLLKKFWAPLLAFFIILAGSGMFWYFHASPASRSKSSVVTESLKPDWHAIAAAQATAAANANYILTDSLHQNIHNWPAVASGDKTYIFKESAYHIADNDATQSAPALLPGFMLSRPLAFSLTMEEIKGDDTSINNSFGMIFFLNTHVNNGKTVITFYSFEVVNNNGGMYQFLKYDSSKGQSPYTTIWQHNFGGEFHQGQGARNTNTFKVTIDGKYFNFWVNGKKVGSTQDTSISRGQIGMLVNLKGTEVAFSNLELTYH
ncbi:MAG TPA: protein kinase [Ktedonobacteraceae bacterium]